MYLYADELCMLAEMYAPLRRMCMLTVTFQLPNLLVLTILIALGCSLDNEHPRTPDWESPAAIGERQAFIRTVCMEIHHPVVYAGLLDAYKPPHFTRGIRCVDSGDTSHKHDVATSVCPLGLKRSLRASAPLGIVHTLANTGKIDMPHGLMKRSGQLVTKQKLKQL